MTDAFFSSSWRIPEPDGLYRSMPRRDHPRLNVMGRAALVLSRREFWTIWLVEVSCLLDAVKDAGVDVVFLGDPSPAPAAEQPPSPMVVVNLAEGAFCGNF